MVDIFQALLYGTIMKILLVEDEIKVATHLQKGLIENGFMVDIAHDGLSGLHLAQEIDYALLILDVMLPKLDGWGMLTRYRNSHATVPVMMLTACDEVDERVKGLHLGADDYLVKPFSFAELLARIHSLLRRSRISDISEGHVLNVGDLHVDLNSMKVKRQGRELQLTAKEFVLLTFFMRNHGKVLSRTMIAEQVWDINFDSDTNVVDVAVKRLRKKIDDPFSDKLLRTKRGLGYLLETGCEEI